MIYNKQELRDIELNTIKKEKNFSIRTLLASIFKALYDLFSNKENISKEDLINVAEQESKKLGIQDYDWHKVFDERGLSNGEQTSISQEGENSYPKNFFIGKSIGDGSCFFDSFRQSLEQQKGIVVSVEQLRKYCQEFASSPNLPKWFEISIKEKNRNGNSGNQISNLDEYKESILNNITWGDSDIEGRILCAKYNIKLHVREAQGDQSQDLLVSNDEILVGSGDKSNIDYNDNNTLHIINSGMNHFEPLLDKRKPMLNNTKNLQQEQADFELARELQIQEDFNLAKDLQAEEVLEYLDISKNSTIYQAEKLKVANVLDSLTNNCTKDTRPLYQIINDIKQNYLDKTLVNKPTDLPSCSMQQTNIFQPLLQSQQEVQ